MRRDGQAVRFTGQLIDARTGAQVWTRRYDHELTNVFAIQTALASDIASELRATLSPQEQKLIARRPTDNVEAYDAFLKVRAGRWSELGQLEALLGHKDEALLNDPKNNAPLF